MRNENKKEKEGEKNKIQETEAQEKKMGCNSSRNWNDNCICYSTNEANRLLAM